MESLAFPSKLSLACTPTPLQPLERLSALLGGPKIWVKRDDLTEFGAGGNKIRKLEYVLSDALEHKARVLITCGGVQSNHCRATALLAAKYGLKTHLILRGNAPSNLTGNVLLDALAGAELSFYPLKEYRALDALFQHWCNHYEAQGLEVYCIPTGASNEVGLWGYIEAAKELAQQIDQLQLEQCHVVCATGSGGTHTGLTLGAHLYASWSVTGFAVCDDAAYFQARAQADLRAWEARYGYSNLTQDLSLQVNDRYIGPGYAVPYPEMIDSIRLLAQTEGLLLDPVYTGKAFHGLVDAIKRGQMRQFENVIFVHTGGVFGLFPFGEQLLE